jgi:hypothetical protein
MRDLRALPIGSLPSGTKVLGMRFFGAGLVIATDDGPYWTDGTENSLRRIDPSPNGIVMVDGKLN